MGEKKEVGWFPVCPEKGGKNDFIVSAVYSPSLEVGWLPETPQNKIGRRCFLGR